MKTTTTEIFSLFFMLWVSFMLYLAYRKFLRGTMGPILRKDEVEEEWDKVIVLERHGLKPNEENRKHSFFGFFSWLTDEFEPEEIQKSDKLED